MLQGIIPFAHQLLSDHVKTGDHVIDATCGNGNDTLFLSELVSDEGQVYAFDIQKQAIDTTKDLLSAHDRHNVTLIQDSHAKLDQYIEKDREIAAAIFNLGYLPRSDKKVITRADSTIMAVKHSLERLQKGGLIILVVYSGHPGGKEEKDALIEYVTKLDQKRYFVLQYQFINLINHPPFVLAIQKK